MARNIEDIFGGVVEAPGQKYFRYFAVGGETQVEVDRDFLSLVLFLNGTYQDPGKAYTIDGRVINLAEPLNRGVVVSAVLNTRWRPQEYEGQFSQTVEFVSTGTETEYKPNFSFSSIFMFVDGQAWTPTVDYTIDGGSVVYNKPLPANKQTYIVFNGAQGDLSSYEPRQTAKETKEYLDGKIETNKPRLFLSVSSQSAMLELKAKLNDSCERTDITPKRIYFLAGSDPSDINNWKPFTELSTLVSSVNGKTGDVKVAESGVNSDITDLTALSSTLTLGADAEGLTDATSLGQVTKLIAAKNTSSDKFTSIKNDATLPARGTTTYGGEIVSSYQVGGVDYSSVKLRSKTTVGGTIVPEISLVDTSTTTKVNKAWPLPSTAGELVQTNDVRLSSLEGKAGGNVAGSVTLVSGGMRVNGEVLSIPNTACFNWVGGTGILDIVDNKGTGTGGISLRIVNQDNSSNIAVYNLQSSGVGLAPGGWQTASDERVKENIKDIDPAKALESVLALRTVTFKMRDKPDGNGGWTEGDRSAGYLAQDLYKYLPEAVSQMHDSYYPYQFKGDDGKIQTITDLMSVDPGKASAALNGAAIKGLYKLIEDLQERVVSLESEVEELKK